jgi:hypothetical protein
LFVQKLLKYKPKINKKNTYINQMNNLKKILLCVSIPLLSLLLIILLVEIRTQIALNDYSMLPDGVKVVDKVVLGRRKRSFSSEELELGFYREFDNGIDKAFRRDAIELLCTNRGNILLVLKLLNFRGLVIDDRPFLQIHDGSLRGGKVPIKNINYLDSGYFHTIVSDPLSEREITSIIKALEKSNFTTISFYAMEGGNLFTNEAKVSKVKKLIDRCQPSISTNFFQLDRQSYRLS